MKFIKNRHLHYSLIFHFILIVVVFFSLSFQHPIEIEKPNKIEISFAVQNGEPLQAVKSIQPTPIHDQIPEIPKEIVPEIKPVEKKVEKKIEEKKPEKKPENKIEPKKEVKKETKKEPEKKPKAEPKKEPKPEPKKPKEKEEKPEIKKEPEKKPEKKPEKTPEKLPEKKEDKKEEKKPEKKEEKKEEKTADVAEKKPQENPKENPKENHKENQYTFTEKAIEGLNLLAREKFNIQNQIKRCYKRALDQARVKNKTIIMAHIVVAKDGVIDLQKVIIKDFEKYTDPKEIEFKKAVDVVKQSLKFCSPIRNLPADKYDVWKEIDLQFDGE